MPKYIIEREVPGAGKLTDAQLKGLSMKSVEVLRDMGPKIQWLESFVTEDKLYCVYLADSPETILEHAKCGGFPANKISKVRAIISPLTAE
jgi:hypothetical protein